MAQMNGVRIMILLHFILLLISNYLSLTLCSASSERRTISTQNMLKNENEIIQIENGDIIDCVSLYKQPALNHPLLKNHTIQLRPNALESENSETYDQCPEGTIPILRKSMNQSDPDSILLFDSIQTGFQNAYFTYGDGHRRVYGTESEINIWNPRLGSPLELSGVFMQMQAQDQNPTRNVNVIGVGWMVSPPSYGNSDTRLTIFWSTDGRMHLNNDGFVQTNKMIKFVPGGTVKPSIYGDPGQQTYTLMGIHRDNGTGNWWLSYDGNTVGYWPKELFSETGLQFPAETVVWGGLVLNSGETPGQTLTEMGSGHFPNEGYTKACFIRHLKIFNEEEKLFIPGVNDLQGQITNKNCYDAQAFQTDEFGTHIFIGGNGGNNRPYCN